MAEGVYSCHPRQMITKKPLNINDEEIFDGMTRVERPSSRPTTMSYSLLRIRLAEISRNLVDRAPLAMVHHGGLSRDDVMDIDTELQMLINDAPPFFSMSQAKLIEAYDLSLAQARDIFHQGYTFYFLLYAQRCKLHLPYFTRGFVDATYSSSRELCIRSARLIIQCESRMGVSGVCTAIRFKLSSLLLGAFMASIVLLMDLCLTKSSQRHEKQREEVAEAFRILEDAKKESETAAKFVDSWNYILRKHQVPPPKPVLTQQFPTPSGEDPVCDIPVVRAHSESLQPPPCGASSNTLGVNSNADGLPDTEDLSSYFNELAQSFEQGNDVGNFDWDNIFSDLDSFI